MSNWATPKGRCVRAAPVDKWAPPPPLCSWTLNGSAYDKGKWQSRQGFRLLDMHGVSCVHTCHAFKLYRYCVQENDIPRPAGFWKPAHPQSRSRVMWKRSRGVALQPQGALEAGVGVHPELLSCLLPELPSHEVVVRWGCACPLGPAMPFPGSAKPMVQAACFIIFLGLFKWEPMRFPLFIPSIPFHVPE